MRGTSWHRTKANDSGGSTITPVERWEKEKAREKERVKAGGWWGVWEVRVVLAPVDVPYRTNTLRVHHLSIHHHPPTTEHATTHTVLHTQYTPVIHNWPCCTTLSSFISLSPSLSLLENKLSICPEHIYGTAFSPAFFWYRTSGISSAYETIT